ncbi:MAG: acylglycerol kinase family protein, partial [Crocinitomicaceae bacterium]|nr:acylglycerol kinase family protein [Crocinitomicaceae bacterium]
MKTKVAFIVNSKRKFSSLAKKTLTLVKMQERLDCHFYNTESQKHATTLAKECADNGFDCIIVVGGDGTANEVVNGLMLSKRKLGVYFGIIPNGSGNDFQTVLEPFEPEEFVEKLISRQCTQMDIIKLTTKKGIYYAMNIAGIGF